MPFFCKLNGEAGFPQLFEEWVNRPLPPHLVPHLKQDQLDGVVFAVTVARMFDATSRAL